MHADQPGVTSDTHTFTRTCCTLTYPRIPFLAHTLRAPARSATPTPPVSHFVERASTLPTTTHPYPLPLFRSLSLSPTTAVPTRSPRNRISSLLRIGTTPSQPCRRFHALMKRILWLHPVPFP